MDRGLPYRLRPCTARTDRPTSAAAYRLIRGSDRGLLYLPVPIVSHGDVGGGEQAAVHIAGAECGAVKPYPATSVEPLLDRTHAAPSPSVLG